MRFRFYSLLHLFSFCFFNKRTNHAQFLHFPANEYDGKTKAQGRLFRFFRLAVTLASKRLLYDDASARLSRFGSVAEVFVRLQKTPALDPPRSKGGFVGSADSGARRAGLCMFYPARATHERGQPPRSGHAILLLHHRK